MLISEETIKILKNFSTINPSLLVKEGNLLATRSIAGHMVAEAQIEEQFPVQFALYDLVEFINMLKLFNSPVLDFRHADKNYMYICEEDDLDFKVRYVFANEERIVYPERRPTIKDIDVRFILDIATLDSISKAASIMQLPNMMVLPNPEAGKINIEVTDVKNTSANKFSIAIDGESPDKDFKLIFRMDTFKMIPGDYDVGIAGKRFSLFSSDKLNYFIALDLDSRN